MHLLETLLETKKLQHRKVLERQFIINILISLIMDCLLNPFSCSFIRVFYTYSML